jgi:hypothetical protein
LRQGSCCLNSTGSRGPPSAMKQVTDRIGPPHDHPTATLYPTELQAILLHLARECDRLEYLLTGRNEQ